MGAADAEPVAGGGVGLGPGGEGASWVGGDGGFEGEEREAVGVEGGGEGNEKNRRRREKNVGAFMAELGWRCCR